MATNIKIDPSSTSSFYFATDAKDADFGITGTLRDGELSFVVEADKSKGSVSGTEFFNAMMEYFDPIHVTVLVGDWHDLDPIFRTNIDTFNALTKAGDTQEQAALKTWTGQRAKDWGYTEVEIIRALPPNSPGKYKVVRVYFRKAH